MASTWGWLSHFSNRSHQHLWVCPLQEASLAGNLPGKWHWRQKLHGVHLLKVGVLFHTLSQFDSHSLVCVTIGDFSCKIFLLFVEMCPQIFPLCLTFIHLYIILHLLLFVSFFFVFVSYFLYYFTFFLLLKCTLELVQKRCVQRGNFSKVRVKLGLILDLISSRIWACYGLRLNGFSRAPDCLPGTGDYLVPAFW